MHHPGPLDAEQAEHFCERLYPLLGVYAYHLEFGAGRIGQRSEQVEDRARPELASDLRHVTHCGVMGQART